LDQPAELLIVGAHVWTGDAGRPRASAVGVRGGKVAFVGSDESARRLAGPQTEVVEADGKLLLPGFVDAHNHVRLGSNPLAVDLAGAGTLEGLKVRVRDHATAHPEQAWVEGVGWNYSAMPDGHLPTWEDLEGVTAGKPAFLFSYDVHTVWLNRDAMRVFGIERGVERVPFGRVRADERGEPTGLVTDFAVMGIAGAGQAALEGVVPGYARERQYASTLESLDMAAGFGITTVLDPQNSPADLWIFERARAEGRLRSRLVAGMVYLVGTTEADREAFEAARDRLDDDRLRVGPVKLYIDDVIEPWTAAMLEPYANRPDERGDLYWEPSEFNELVTDLESRGFPCHVHAIGDRGIRTALDAFEAARAVNGPGDRRHAMVHVECLAPDDIARFAALGVIPVMQPRHCAPEITAGWRANVGPQRWRHAWAFRSLRDAGAQLAFSSDWNVAEMDPLIGIYTALTRADLDGGPGWVTEQTVDLDTALRAYTYGGARTVFAEGDRGIIRPRSVADLVLLSDDPFAFARSDPRRLLDTRVELTIVGGTIVHRAVLASLCGSVFPPVEYPKRAEGVPAARFPRALKGEVDAAGVDAVKQPAAVRLPL
jgi:predicted amidohydrolase YtcJ